MSDNSNNGSQEVEQSVNGEVEPATGEGQEPDVEELRREAERWKHLSRQNEAKAKSNAEKAKLWDQYEDSRKTEDQKREEALKAERAEIDAARHEIAVDRALIKYGLSDDHRQFLGTGPEDEIDNRAKTLSELVGKAPKPVDKSLGNETPPAGSAGGSGGDWLREMISSR